MNIFEKNNTYSIYIKANSKEEKIIHDNSTIIIHLQAPAIDNKANQALVKFFKKKLGLEICILVGKKSKKKIIKIL